MGKKRSKRNKAGYKITVPSSDNRDVPACYSIDLDKLDLGLLPIDSLLDKLRSNPESEALVLWQPKDDAFCESYTLADKESTNSRPFTVHALRDTGSPECNEHSTSPTDQQSNKQPTSITESVQVTSGSVIQCHICSLAIPETYMTDHVRSETHLALFRLTNTALSRFNKYTEQLIDQMTREVRESALQMPKCHNTISSAHYCIPCNATVERSSVEFHERELDHLCSVKRHAQLVELCTVYMNGLAIETTENVVASSVDSCPVIENINGSSSGDLASHKGSVSINNMDSHSIHHLATENINNSSTDKMEIIHPIDDLTTEDAVSSHLFQPTTITYSAILREKTSEDNSHTVANLPYQTTSQNVLTDLDGSILNAIKKDICGEDRRMPTKIRWTEIETTNYVLGISGSVLKENEHDGKTTTGVSGRFIRNHEKNINCVSEETENSKNITNSVSEKRGKSKNITDHAREESEIDKKITSSASEGSVKVEQNTNRTQHESEIDKNITKCTSEKSENDIKITNIATKVSEKDEKIANRAQQEGEKVRKNTNPASKIKIKNCDKYSIFASENESETHNNTTKRSSEKFEQSEATTNSVPGSTNSVSTENLVASVNNDPKHDKHKNNIFAAKDANTTEVIKAAEAVATNIQKLAASLETLDTDSLDNNSTQWYHCKECQTTVPNNSENIIEHNNGKKHNKKVAANKAKNLLSKTNNDAEQLNETKNASQQTNNATQQLGAVKIKSTDGIESPVNVSHNDGHSKNTSQKNEIKSENALSSQKCTKANEAHDSNAKKPFSPYENRDTNMWYYHCEVCQTYITNNTNSIKAHIEGNAHRSKANRKSGLVGIGRDTTTDLDNQAPSVSTPKRTRENKQTKSSQSKDDLKVCPICPRNQKLTENHENCSEHQLNMDGISRLLRQINFMPLKESLSDNAVMTKSRRVPEPVLSKANWNGLVADEVKMEYRCILCEEVVGYSFIQYHNHVDTTRHQILIGFKPEEGIREIGFKKHHCVVCNVIFHDYDAHVGNFWHLKRFHEAAFFNYSSEVDTIITALTDPHTPNETSGVVSGSSAKSVVSLTSMLPVLMMLCIAISILYNFTAVE